MATVVTKTIKPSGGGDYTTLAAAYTARARNLVTADEIEDWECYAGNLGALTTGSALTTNATHYLQIRAASSDRHTGVWSTSKAYIQPPSGERAIRVSAASAAFMRVYGLLIEGVAGNDAIYGYRAVSGYNECMLLDGCIVRGPGGTGGYYGVNAIAKMVNCVVYGFDGTGGRGAFLSYVSSAYNCSFLNCATGVYVATAGQATVINCLANGCSDGYYGTFNSASDYNVSDISSDAPGANSVTGSVTFVDATNNDYHLSTSDTVARGAGVNLTSSGITDDIDGDARPSSGAWDIGADQTPVAQNESGSAVAQLAPLGGRSEGVAGAGSPAVATLPALSASASGSQGFSGDATERFRDISARATGTRSGAAATSLAALIERNRIHSDNAYIFLAEIALPSGTTLRLAADPQSWVWPNADAAQGMLADTDDSVSFSLPSGGALTALVDSGFGGTVYLQRQTGPTTWFTMATFTARATEELTGLVPGTYRLVAHSDFTGECNAVLAGAGSHVWQSFNFDFDSYREGEDARRATLQLKVSNANMAVMRYVEQLEDWRKANGRFPCTLRLLCVNTALLDEDTPTGEFWFEDQRISCPAPMDWVFFEVGSPNLWARTVPARRVIRNFCAWRTTDECPHIASCDHSLTNCRAIAATIDPGRTEYFGGVPFVGDGAHYA